MKHVRCHKRGELGFTLIEVLLVVVIIGVLAVIAISQFAYAKGNAFCSKVESDAGNAVVALEAHFAAHLEYGTLQEAGFRGSKGVTLEVVSTDPLTIQATDETGSCAKGGTFTLSQGKGVWS
ncbi:MAG: prepilin-type N-terminal cleavage/methylation domain-containing protein [Bacillota bacterium]|jgi:prepilin-type N-terminal cleavage/methylation domain-containing protein